MRSKLERILRTDSIVQASLRTTAVVVLVVIAYFLLRFAAAAGPAFSRFGIIGFVFTNNWDVAHNIFGAWPLVAGTLITATVALVLGVPVAVAAALYVTELAPGRLRGGFALMLDLLAAVPSVVYGLWGVFILIPTLRPLEQWFSNTFSFLPFVGRSTTSRSSVSKLHEE